MPDPSLIVALTGASGIIYALRLLENIELARSRYRMVYVVYTSSAEEVALIEENVDLKAYLKSVKGVNAVFHESELSSEIASSSNLVNASMVIVPASMNTVSKIANGIQDNLVTRVANAVIRLRNRLIVVFRETPLSAIDLFNLYKLSVHGAIILPASPGFYIKPRSIDDLVNFIVGKIFDALGVEHNLYRRYTRETT
ncbi:MAG: UbiX family flavin prenyltransferase [Desulfurococcus sp.]|nr:UbiX family flavin prenyltransferase [Desulfurococcus sp.]